MTHMAEAALVDLTDDELKELLGYSYEAVKKLEEAKKNDAFLIETKTKVDEYTTEHYTQHIKKHRARLKAARAQAHVRGIRWKAPDQL